jgi:phosphinothricin acetyltransferase
VTIRAAETRDAPVVAALWNAMIRDTMATFTTTEWLFTDVEALIAARPNAFWVAEDQGRVAGFVTFGSFRAGPGYAATVEHTIILDAGAQGRGLGRALMTRAMDAARESGMHVMVAAISSANPPAQAFHKNIGFQQTGQLPEVGRKHGLWLDLILMQKTLTPS